MNAFAQCLLASRLDRWQAVAQHRGEDRDYLAIAVGNFGELAADSPQPGGQPLVWHSTSYAGGTLASLAQSLNGAPFLSAPGLRARTGTSCQGSNTVWPRPKQR